MALRAKFKPGDGGQFHEGIPARDLSEEDWDALSDEHKATASASPLYELRGDARAEGDRAERRAARAADEPKGGD